MIIKMLLLFNLIYIAAYRNEVNLKIPKMRFALHY